MKHILVCGSLNMDLVVKTSRAPKAGETITGMGFHTIPGGKGANQAVAISRLGGQAAMLGRVGDDDFGEELLRNLADNRVNIDQVIKDKDAPTGIALIVVDEMGENRIILVPGANGMVGLEDSQRGHHEFAAADLLVIQLEIPLPAVDAAIKKSSALGVDILLNPAPACAIPPDTLAMVKYLVLNETEAGTLTGMEVQGLSSAASAAQELLGMGVGVVVITLGANGAYTAIRDGAFHEPAYIIDPVDTTAAGDAFIGGFTVAISEGQGLQKAVRMGNAAGALAAQKFGAQTSLPNRDDLEAFLKSRA